LNHVEAVHLRQPEVEQDGIGVAAGGELERLLAAAGQQWFKPAGAQVDLERLEDTRIVVNDEDPAHGTPPE
jgi:hypothetical protein